MYKYTRIQTKSSSYYGQRACFLYRARGAPDSFGGKESWDVLIRERNRLGRGIMGNGIRLTNRADSRIHGTWRSFCESSVRDGWAEVEFSVGHDIIVSISTCAPSCFTMIDDNPILHASVKVRSD